MRKHRNELLPVLSDYFTEYLPIVKGLSPNSIRSYQYAFQLLFEFLASEKQTYPEKVDFKNLEGTVTREFLAWLEAKRGCSISSRNQRLSALSSFSSYAINKCPSSALRFYTDVSAVPQKKKPERTPVYFTRTEVSVLLKLPDGSTKASARDRVLLSVLYASGARAQELCDITVSDIRFDGKTAIKLVGKGNKGRIVTIPDKCAELLLFYLKSNDLSNKPDKYVFSSQTHEHMSISCIEGIVKKYVRLAKKQNQDIFPEKHYTPHSFRHSIAVHMLESEIPLPVIKNFLGHTSIETTMIYATVSADLTNRYLKNKSILNDMIPTEQNIGATTKPRLDFLKMMKK
ncbi:MAG: tyrosine-type recombinase/integrase [Paenibacillaceae bacterium]